MVGLEVGVLGGEGPGDGKELVLGGEFFPKKHEVLAEVVFAGENAHSWIEKI